MRNKILYTEKDDETFFASLAEIEIKYPSTFEIKGDIYSKFLIADHQGLCKISTAVDLPHNISEEIKEAYFKIK